MYQNGEHDGHSYGTETPSGSPQVRYKISDRHSHQASPSFQEKWTWNGLSPRNRANQKHYERVRDSSTSSLEGEESAVEDHAKPTLSSSVRKRLGSPSFVNPQPSKRWKEESNENTVMSRSFTPQRNILGRPALGNTPVKDLTRVPYLYGSPRLPLSPVNGTQALHTPNDQQMSHVYYSPQEYHASVSQRMSTPRNEIPRQHSFQSDTHCNHRVHRSTPSMNAESSFRSQRGRPVSSSLELTDNQYDFERVQHQREGFDRELGSMPPPMLPRRKPRLGIDDGRDLASARGINSISLGHDNGAIPSQVLPPGLRQRANTVTPETVFGQRIQPAMSSIGNTLNSVKKREVIYNPRSRAASSVPKWINEVNLSHSDIFGLELGSEAHGEHSVPGFATMSNGTSSRLGIPNLTLRAHSAAPDHGIGHRARKFTSTSRTQLGSPAFPTTGYRKEQFAQSSKLGYDYDNAGSAQSSFKMAMNAHRAQSMAPNKPHNMPRTPLSRNVTSPKSHTAKRPKTRDEQQEYYQPEMINVDDDIEGNETLEEIMKATKIRQSPQFKSVPEGSPAKELLLTKPLDFMESQRDWSIRSSSQEEAVNRTTQENGLTDSLCIIRTPRPTTDRMTTDLNGLNTPSINGDRTKEFMPGDSRSRGIVTDGDSNAERRKRAKEAKSQRKAEEDLKHQKQALEKIAQQEKRAKQLKSHDGLFEDVPLDEDAEARIKKSVEEDIKKKNLKADAHIVGEYHKATLAALEASRKERAAKEAEARKAEKKSLITDEERARLREKEAERVEQKRLAAAERLDRERRERETGEAAKAEQSAKEVQLRHEELNKIKAEREAAKERAATLIASKKTDSKVTSGHEAPKSEKSKEKCAFAVGTSEEGLFAIGEAIIPPEDGKSLNQSQAAEKVQPINGNGNGNQGNAQESQTTTKAGASTSISAAASDSRQRNLASRQKAPSRRSPDRQISDSVLASRRDARAARNSELVGREAWLLMQRTLAEVEQLKAEAKVREEKDDKAWEARIDRLEAMFKAHGNSSVEKESASTAPAATKAVSKHNREESASKPRPASADGATVQNGQFRRSFGTPSVNQLIFTSEIKLVSQVQAEEKQREKAEEARVAKYEKDKQRARRRHEKDIRVVMSSQGIELDEDKLKKALDEKMLAWVENRQKKEQKSFKLNRDGSHDTNNLSQSQNQADNEQTMRGSDDAESNDPETQEIKKREQVVRAGMDFLVSQNDMSRGFAKAASKTRTEDLESEESEEDPDDVPEHIIEPTSTTNNVAPASAAATSTADFPAGQVMPPLLDLPQKPQEGDESPAVVPKKLPLDIVNLPEENMIHAYKVRHRAERGDDVTDSVVLRSFHNVEEANTFAQQILSQVLCGPVLPRAGKSETYDENDLYIGRAIVDRNAGHAELIWVTREIIYMGDIANFHRRDLKTIVHPRVFNVVLLVVGDDKRVEADVIATSSIKSLANKKASEHFLQLSRPVSASIDRIKRYKEDIVPTMRKKIEQADENDDVVLLEGGYNEETGKTFSISVSESSVIGPLN